MPTLAQVRNFVDTRLANLWTNQVQPREDVYFAARGRYWQGVITTQLTALPNNPNNGTPTVLEIAPVITGHPSDQAESWSDAGLALGATLPMALEIHTYDGPLGKGYVGVVWARFAGDFYSRAQAVGPEAAARTEAWHLVVPPVMT